MDSSNPLEENVVADFRERIVVDPDTPILACKANRDRYCGGRVKGKEYAGLPYLGSINSEDALTWNVFRSLQKHKCLDIICKWFNIDIGNPEALLLWCLAPEPIGTSAELQFKVGNLIRVSDGKLRGQISEPDVITIGTKGIVIAECKLGEPQNAPSHLWEGSKIERVEQRLSRYKNDFPELLKAEKTGVDIMPIYQLVRMAYFAVSLGNIFNIQPHLVSIASNSNWNKTNNKWKRSAADLWDDFVNSLGSINLVCRVAYWQSLEPLLAGSTLNKLQEYLVKHKCLQS